MNPPPPRPSLVQLLSLGVFLFLAGAIIAHVSMTMHPRFHTSADAVGSQLAILQRTPASFSGQTDDIHNWRNRVMVPYAIAAISKIAHSSFSSAYVLMRWLTATAAFAAFMWLARRALALELPAAVAAAMMLAVSIIPTFIHIYEIPSDFLDATFFSLLTILCLEKRRGLFLFVMVIALLNRESAVFATVVWFLVNGFSDRFAGFIREAVWCVICGAIATAVVIGLRTLNAGHAAARLAQGVQTFEPALFWSTNLRMLHDFLNHPNFSHPYFYLGGYLMAVSLLLVAEWQKLTVAGRRLIQAALSIFLLSIISNNLDELRIFIPSLVLVTLVLASIAWRRPVLPAADALAKAA